MTEMTDSAARAFARDWVAGWSAHDIERVLARYGEDGKVRSATACYAIGLSDAGEG